MDLYTALAILAVTVASLLTRSGPQLLGAHQRLPATVDAALRYAPACALAGIIVPDLVFVDGAAELAFDNPKLLAGAAAIVIFAASRSMIATISGGMAVFWLVRMLFVV